MARLGVLEEIASGFGQTKVEAGQFFLSWNSVLTLAYRPLSKTLLDIKSRVSQEAPGLNAENSGSKWPKTTLGCLDDGVSLDINEAYRLLGICEDYSGQVRALTYDDRSMPVKALEAVVFSNRTLEDRLVAKDLPLSGEMLADDRPDDE